jgi:hypothetical protein
MTFSQAAELALSWLALLAATAAVLSPRVSPWSWGVAGLLFSAWLALMAPPGIGAVVAAGALVALFLEGHVELAELDFTSVTRRLGLLLAGFAVAAVLMVRVAEVDPGDAPYVFPALATGIVALIVLLAATDEAEIHRAARLLLVLATVGWTVATAGTQPAAAIIAAAALPLLALTGRLGRPTELETPARPETPVEPET